MILILIDLVISLYMHNHTMFVEANYLYYMIFASINIGLILTHLVSIYILYLFKLLANNTVERLLLIPIILYILVTIWNISLYFVWILYF